MIVRRDSTIILFIISIITLVLPTSLLAAAKRDWSVAPIFGVHNPKLDAVNHGLFQSPFAGTSDKLLSSGASESTLLTIHNDLKPFNPGPYTGLEFSWRMDDKLSWLGGIGNWANSSHSARNAIIPFQREWTHVLYDRKVTFSYNEVFIGLRRDWIYDPQKYRVYGRLSLNTLFDVNLRENMAFRFKLPEGERVTRSIIVESQTTAAMLTETGLGAELFVGERFSLGIEGTYTFSMRETFFRYPTKKEDFKDSDGYGVFRTPVKRGSDGWIQYLDRDGEKYLPMPLDFNGWKILVRVSMFY